jgi:D-alanyl-D-alanine carboxypeptidase (penicillin-binding protein 5/6)
MKKYLYSLLFILCFIGAAHGAAFTTPARSAFLIDTASGADIVNKAGDTLMHPSSMLKLMTLAMVFDAVKSGELKLDEMLPVSRNADRRNRVWARASKVCLEEGQTISVNDIIMGLIVMSGGDAGVVVAERLTGSEAGLAAAMTQRAREIGMPKSTFGNVSGLHHPDNLMTSRELAHLAQYLMNEHPEFYPLFATRRWVYGRHESDWCREWGRLKTTSYNRLLFIMPSAEGMKTGRTTEAGFGMVAVAHQGGRRLIAVINGLAAKDHNHLAREAKKLLQHGFNTTENRTFFNPGDEIVKIPTWYGRRNMVTATVANPFVITLPRGHNTADLRILARHYYPVKAPVRKGDTIGEIVAQFNGDIIARAPLVAKERVGKTIFFGRIATNLKLMILGR